MPHAVFATAGSFYPPLQGDSARLLQLIRFLRRRSWRIDVVHLHSDDHPRADYDAMRARCDRLIVHHAGREWPRGSRRSCDDWCPDSFAAVAARAAAEASADVLVTQFSYLSKCLPLLPPRPKILKVIDADNVFTGRSDVYARAGFDHDWLSTSAADERRALLRADLVLAIQEAEQAFFEALVPERPVLLVPYAEPVVRVSGVERDCLLFVGSPDAAAEAGIREFVRAALPAIRRAHPKTRLLVGGRIAESLTDLGGDVELVGVVDDLARLFRRAAIVLNTEPCGTGLKIKTASALCHGKCLVTTPAGAHGLERYSDAYFLARSSAEFAETVVALLRDRVEIRAAEERAFAFASRYLEPDTVYGRLDQALRDRLAVAPVS